jgi:uncharacterized iron-regulated membrane protein
VSESAQPSARPRPFVAQRGGREGRRATGTKRLFQLHSWLGIAASGLLLVIGATGSVLVFADEIDRTLRPQLHMVVPRATAASLDAMYEAVRLAYPQAVGLRFRRFPDAPDRSAELVLTLPGAPGQARRLQVYVDPYTARILGARDPEGQESARDNPTGFLLHVHRTLLGGKAGESLTAVAAVLLLLATATGALVYRRSLLRVLLFRVRIRRLDLRAAAADVHRVVGVWFLLFNVTLAATGLWFQRQVFSAAHYRGSNRPALSGNVPPLSTSLDGLIARLQTTLPAFRPLGQRAGRADEIVLYGEHVGQSSFLSRFASSVVFDARTGQQKSVSLIGDAPFLRKLEASVVPLHFGTFGGTATRVIYVFAGLAPTLLSLTGFVLWLRRRRWQASRR